MKYGTREVSGETLYLECPWEVEKGVRRCGRCGRLFARARMALNFTLCQDCRKAIGQDSRRREETDVVFLEWTRKQDR